MENCHLWWIFPSKMVIFQFAMLNYQRVYKTMDPIGSAISWMPCRYRSVTDGEATPLLPGPHGHVISHIKQKISANLVLSLIFADFNIVTVMINGWMSGFPIFRQTHVRWNIQKPQTNVCFYWTWGFPPSSMVYPIYHLNKKKHFLWNPPSSA